MATSPKTDDKNPADAASKAAPEVMKTEKPGLVQAVHGLMVHPITAEVFEHLKPTKVDLNDSWVGLQMKHGKLAEYKLG